MCVGEFSTTSELKNTTVIPVCRLNSNAGFCRGINPPSPIQIGSLQDIDKNIKQDANNKYYTCLDITGINRAIGNIEVKFENSGTTYCTSKPQNTVPDDWSFSKEGLPGQQGTTDPRGPGRKELFCEDNKSINTALGCVSVEGAGFVTALLNFGIGIAGGIAMLLIIFGGFQILTSAGNPERLNEGKELISSAITGLLMIIFSVFLLRIIGINILGIPSFS